MVIFVCSVYVKVFTAGKMYQMQLYLFSIECHEHTCDKLVLWYKISCAACMLKLSSTLVN